MFETPHYNEIIKKTVVSFGALFSNMQIIRRNSAGVTVEIVKVPIAYGPKEKFIRRIEEDPSLTKHVLITLPRLAFEITGYQFDPSRMTNRSNKIQCFNDSGLSSIYTPVPWNLSIDMNLISKGTEDSLAIIEQILPLFTPEYTFTVNAIPSMNVKTDIPLILNAVSNNPDYEGDFSTRQLTVTTFSFTAKMMLFGATANRGVIQRTDVDLPDVDAHHTSTGNVSTGEIILDEWTEQ